MSVFLFGKEGGRRKGIVVIFPSFIWLILFLSLSRSPFVCSFLSMCEKEGLKRGLL